MYQAAKDLVSTYPGKLNVISVTRDQPVDPKLCKNHLHIPIDDFDTDVEMNMQEPGSTSKLPYKYAYVEDIKAAIEFSKKHKVHIIHCGAGLSRSPAIAYAIFRSQGDSKEEALKKVLQRSPQAEPNKRMVKLTDKIMGD
jgi:predicted protein tyrosine phosphatase